MLIIHCVKRIKISTRGLSVCKILTLNVKNLSTQKFFNSSPGDTPTIQARILNYLEQKVKIPYFNTRNDIRTIDKKLCQNVHLMTINDYLGNVHNLIKYLPNRAAETQFYSLIMSDHLQFEKMEFYNKIQYLFYLSLKKRDLQVQNIINRSILNCDHNLIQQLKIEDFCIITLSAFKTSTLIQNDYFLKQIENFLCKPEIFEDEHILIMLVKTIRHNKFYNDDVMKMISKNLAGKSYNFEVNIHILTLYGSSLYFDEDIVKRLVYDCFEYFRTQHDFRLKIVAAFVWALGFLNFDVSRIPDFEEVITRAIFASIGNVQKNGDTLVDCILSMLMLNLKPRKLIEKLDQNVVQNIKGSNNYRNKSRLNLVLTYFEIMEEYPELRYNEFNKFEKKVTSCRDSIHVSEAMLRTKFPDCEFLVNYQVANINIEGITVWKNQEKVAEIEILDQKVCLRNKTEMVPHGIMNLKIKLLEALTVPVIKVTQQSLFDDKKLFSLLQNKTKTYIS